MSPQGTERLKEGRKGWTTRAHHTTHIRSNGLGPQRYCCGGLYPKVTHTLTLRWRREVASQELGRGGLRGGMDGYDRPWGIPLKGSLSGLPTLLGSRHHRRHASSKEGKLRVPDSVLPGVWLSRHRLCALPSLPWIAAPRQLGRREL